MKTLIKTELQNGAYNVGKSSNFEAFHQANERQKAKKNFLVLILYLLVKDIVSTKWWGRSYALELFFNNSC